MGAGYLQTGYYAGFFLAAAANYTIGAYLGWRAMFLCGLTPVIVSLAILFRVQEPEKWKAHGTEAHSKSSGQAQRKSPLIEIFRGAYLKRTLVNGALLTIAIIGLWAGAVYEPTAIIALAKKAGMDAPAAARMASVGTGTLAIGTILGCLALPPMAERFGRRPTLAFYFAGMSVTIATSFGWIFYRHDALVPFIASLFVLGFFGGNFAMFSLWLPEQYDTNVRATAFALTTSFGRFIGAGVNFLLAWAVLTMGTVGKPVALTSLAFLIGLLVLPFAMETRGRPLPN
jgi:MFS family permease